MGNWHDCQCHKSPFWVNIYLWANAGMCFLPFTNDWVCRCREWAWCPRTWRCLLSSLRNEEHAGICQKRHPGFDLCLLNKGDCTVGSASWFSAWVLHQSLGWSCILCKMQYFGLMGRISKSWEAINESFLFLESRLELLYYLPQSSVNFNVSLGLW